MDNKKTNKKQTMTDEDMNALSLKIVARMVKLKSMEDWFHHVNKSDMAWQQAYDDLEMTEEEDAISETAKLMTLMNMFQDKEEYEKCAIVKNRIESLQDILDKY